MKMYIRFSDDYIKSFSESTFPLGFVMEHEEFGEFEIVEDFQRNLCHIKSRSGKTWYLSCSLEEARKKYGDIKIITNEIEEDMFKV